VFAVASKFYREKDITAKRLKYNVTILIPSYKEDNVITETARSAVEHISRLSNFEVLVLADSLKLFTIKRLRQTGAKVLTVNFEKSTKAKSIKKALAVVSDDTNYIVVLDADNIMKPGFIDNLIIKMEHGYSVVQGHRTAKNTNTNFAFLDGLSEEINNNIFRKGHRVLGLSASLIGSGFACEYKLFKELMFKAEAVGGFDKELELMLLQLGYTIAYANNAIVYDEKIQQPDAFVNQRRRWISAQYVYFTENLGNGLKQLIKYGNIDYFDKLVQFMLPPRIISLGLTFVLAFVYATLLLISGFEASATSLYMWSIIFLVSSAAI
jgi:cellulose synthase/poly-beta-1,6-N-acetylglucosamine synthase-like glycosyltransferase